jgi:penicillin G amidase
MRIMPFLISAAITTGLIAALNTRLPVGNSKTPRLGFFLSPQQGFWQNAEPDNYDFSADIKTTNITGTVEVQLDERLVPHIYAQNEKDAYYVQGWLHARFRLWQMEFQTLAAAGRLSEVLGAGPDNAILNNDRMMRRLGMVYAAERSLAATEADAVTKEECDAYTAGINAYIQQLKPQDLPLEYKLLDYQPELWTNLKTALFLKYMSYDLAGWEADFERDAARKIFGKNYEILYPDYTDTLDPIVNRGPYSFITDSSGKKVTKPALYDSLYNNGVPAAGAATTALMPNKANGSNNWAVAGTKTKTGVPILCNDPHLGLNLPSLWFEVQINTPTLNTYGASFPGAPGVILGFNDSIAWGSTNAMRDVRDYFEIKFKDSTQQEYWFEGGWLKADTRKETILVRDGQEQVENIAVTVFGPVMYDRFYPSRNGDGKPYACRWKAHDASNELKAFNGLNHAKNYPDYLNAIAGFKCPGQNFVFAAHNGDIAIRQQGAFPAKWDQQGKFPYPGVDSTYAWQGDIPTAENPGMYNPSRGFVSSANQRPVDASYPYYMNGNFISTRGFEINRRLNLLEQITPQMMMALQTDNYNPLAEWAKPVLLQYVQRNNLSPAGIKYLDMLSSWNNRNDANENGATIFKLWYDSLETLVWADELEKLKPMANTWPDETILIEAIRKDSAMVFIDNIRTPDKKETLAELVTTALEKAAPLLAQAEADGKLAWGNYKNTLVRHLARLEPLSSFVFNGGGSHSINATTSTHGPSWRMVAQLNKKIEVWCIYPGGQSGNPGSKYYQSFIADWAAGRYYQPKFLSKQEARRSGMKWVITFYNS